MRGRARLFTGELDLSALPLPGFQVWGRKGSRGAHRLNLSLQTIDGPMKVGRVKKKRNSLEIVSEMLEAAWKGSRKTSIMYRTNLSYKLLVAYMSVLRENG